MVVAWKNLVRSVSALIAASSLLAQSPWQAIEVASAPPARTGFALLPIGGDVLLIGGDAANPNASDFAFDGVAWRAVNLGFPRRDNPAVAVFGNERFLVFGGTGAGGPLADTWTSLDGVSWVQVASGSPSGALTSLAMVGDPGQDRAVLIGQSGPGTWETWFFTDVTGWTAGPSFSAPTAQLVADAVRGEVQLHLGGLPGYEVRRLVGSVWTPLTTQPSGPQFGEVAFDARRGKALLLEPFANRATTEWDGLGFGVPQAIGGAFVPSDRTAMAWFAARQEMLLVTNYGGAIEAWRYVASPAPAAFAFGTPCAVANYRIGLVPGDQSLLGGVHRLQVSGPSNGNLNVTALGLSTAQFAGVPLPLPLPVGVQTCPLLVEPLVLSLLGTTLPVTQSIALPGSPSLLGARYATQAVQLGAAGFAATSNGLQVQFGLPLPESELIESFSLPTNRDLAASGDTWSGGAVSPARIGGDGRHGSFDAAFGQSLGNNVFEWNTDNQTIPASATLSGQSEVVSDGRFFFSDLVVPAGVTVRFVGSAPVQLFVRGRVDVQGTIDVSAADMPAVIGQVGLGNGQRVTNFNARGSFNQLVQGQVGGPGGPGGGRGGNGGNECDGNGPATQVVGGVTVFLNNGQNGEDVRVSAAHAYLAQAIGTGGAGSPLAPSTGLNATALTQLVSVWRAAFSRGGGGGGYMLAGVGPTLPVIGTGVGSQPFNSAPVPQANAFPLLPLPQPAPVGFRSLDHFLVGGSGGGGGGSHTFGLLQGSAATSVGERFLAGHAGSGGGGALAIRAGGNLAVGSGAALRARGGNGVLILGDDPFASPSVQDSNYGISSPGGGGSGGSVLLQADGLVQFAGAVDTSGGLGSRVGGIFPQTLSVQAQAGAGSNGFYRIEQPFGGIVFTGTGVPAFTAGTNTGTLTDSDARTGSRSIWLLPSSPGLPVYVRYELLVRINGLPVLFSDDPSLSPLAADDPAGPVQLRFQGGRFDPLTGTVAPGSVGPWRSKLAAGTSSVNRDYATMVRFDLVLDKTQGVSEVLELRIVYR
ncbi:MAG: hypothetical protein ACK5UQ_15150 [Planctomycetota bacterium]